MYLFAYHRAALDRAVVLLRMSMGGLRIDNLWGAGGGQRPVTQLIKEVRRTHTHTAQPKANTQDNTHNPNSFVLTNQIITLHTLR